METIDLLVFSGGLDDKRIEFKGEDPTLVGVTPTGFHFLGDAPEQLDVELPIALWGARYVSLETARAPLELTASVKRPMWGKPVLDLETGAIPRVQELWVVVAVPGGYMVHHHTEPVLANAHLELELDLERYQLEQTTTPRSSLLNALIEDLCGAQVGDHAFVLLGFARRLGVAVHPNVLPRDTWSFAAVEIPLEVTQGYPPGLAGLVPIGEELRTVDGVAGIDSSLEVREVVYTIHSPQPPLRLDLVLGLSRLPDVESHLEAYQPADDAWVSLGSDAATDETPRDNRIPLRSDTPETLDPRSLYDSETRTIKVRQRVTLPRGFNYKDQWIQTLQVQQLVWDPAAVDAPHPEPDDPQ